MRSCWFCDDDVFSQEFLESRDYVGGKAELAAQHPAQLNYDNLACDEFVFGKNVAKNIGAQAARGKRAHQNISVEEDPHETSLNTSSSVR